MHAVSRGYNEGMNSMQEEVPEEKAIWTTLDRICIWRQQIPAISNFRDCECESIIVNNIQIVQI